MSASPRKSPQGRRITHRSKMIMLISIARKQIGIEESDYRSALFDITGQTSIVDCSDDQLEAVLDFLKSKGFKPASAKPQADNPMARKARALWMSLYHLGAVKNPAEQALEAFAARQLGCTKMAWADQRQAYRLIEALKNMGVRAGWSELAQSGGGASPALFQASLCRAILRRLQSIGVADKSWNLGDAVAQLTQLKPLPEVPSARQYQGLALVLGTILRRHQSNGASNG